MIAATTRAFLLALLLGLLGYGLVLTPFASTPWNPPTSSQEPDVEQRISELGISLPEPSKSLAIYKRIVVVDKMAYLSGHIPIDEAGEIMKGKVGLDVDIEKGAQAARRCGLALLSTLKNEIGSLNKVKRLVKTTGMVNCTSDFTQQPEVINGCSQLIVDIWGDDDGKGARAAVGMSSLPRGAICEIEMIFELKK